jgi:type IV secretory pathway TrbF-like protein
MADVRAQAGGTNGHRFATLPPALAEHAEMIVAVMQETKASLDSRDASAERHKWLAIYAAALEGVLLALALLVVAFLAWDRRDVQAFVQVVQHTEEGHLVQVGVPMKLLEYEPQEAAWEDMLSLWTKFVNWRGEDLHKQEHEEWRWVVLHTCPSARKHLEALKRRDKPFARTPNRVQVTIKSITKLPPTQSYQVLWEKLATGPGLPGKPELKATTYTVGRIALKTLAEAQENRLGICVASFMNDDR